MQLTHATAKMNLRKLSGVGLKGTKLTQKVNCALVKRTRVIDDLCIGQPEQPVCDELQIKDDYHNLVGLSLAKSN